MIWSILINIKFSPKGTSNIYYADENTTFRKKKKFYNVNESSMIFVNFEENQSKTGVIKSQLVFEKLKSSDQGLLTPELLLM